MPWAASTPECAQDARAKKFAYTENRTHDKALDQSELIATDCLCSEISKLAIGSLHNVAKTRNSKDPLSKITEELRKRQLSGSPVHSLDIVGHGAPGGLALGGHWIGRKELIRHFQELTLWNIKTIFIWSRETLNQSPNRYLRRFWHCHRRHRLCNHRHHSSLCCWLFYCNRHC